MNAPTSPFPSSSQIASARMLIEATVEDAERWSAKLDLINRKVIADPDGNEGARLEGLILRAQAIIDRQVSFVTGVDVTRLDSARGL